MTFSSTECYFISDKQTEGCPILITCSSREGLDSSGSSVTTRTSRRIRLTVCTIGLVGQCGTLQ